jgi:hypothetical protein
MNGHLVSSCSNGRGCFFSVHIELPPIKKKIIYLDTSVVSRMAKAKARKEQDSLDLKLYEALRRAAARNLIVCPGSAIVETEAELSALSDIIIDMSRHLSDPGLHYSLQVQETQILRVLDAWLNAQQPEGLTALPWQDAFRSDPDAWHSTFKFSLNIRMPDDFIAAARVTKTSTLPVMEEMYRAYKRDEFTFGQIVENEMRAFPEAVRITGHNLMAARHQAVNGELPDVDVWWLSTFDKIAMWIEHRTKCSIEEAFERTNDFLRSSHASATPYSQIASRLQAQLAILCRGDQPRLPDDGDHYDVEHIATFVPYVDILIADKFFAGIANQKNLEIGTRWGTKIRSLVPKEVPDFIDWLESLADENETARLSERITAAIWQGGFIQDFIAHMKATTPEVFTNKAE